MSKTEVEDTLDLDVSFLRRHRYFQRSSSGTITWTRSGAWGERKNSVGIRSFMKDPEGAYIRINYSQTDRGTGEKKDFNYQIPLATTECNFGGIRYWFICPWYKNGRYCGRRVGKIYKDGDYFACRHCYELSYRSRNENRRFALFSHFFNAERRYEELKKKTKRRFYAGKPTKKYMRLMELQDKASYYGRFINEEDLFR